MAPARALLFIDEIEALYGFTKDSEGGLVPVCPDRFSTA